MTFKKKTFEESKATYKPMQRGTMRNTGSNDRMRNTPTTRITHEQLVDVAREWLRRHHPVVLTELTTTGECADALGFNHAGGTTLIECKASRADFHADKKKVFRRIPERGMGLHRYFLATAGLLHPDELPPGWGLLEWNGRYVRIKQHGPPVQSRNHDAERGALVSTLRRLGKRVDIGVSIQCYSFERYKRTTGRESKNKATLSVLIEDQ